MAAPPANRTRVIAIIVGGAIATPSIAVALLALNTPATLTYIVTTALVVLGAAFANKLAPTELATLPKNGRTLFALWLILSAVAVYRIASLACFIEDPSRTEYAFKRIPRTLDNDSLTKPFYIEHNCSTCYLVAAHLADESVENIYDTKHYRNAEVKTPIHDEIGETFNIDQYQYPPPFLLGPYAAYKTGLDFFQLRSLWFALSVLLFVATSATLTVWICGWRFNPLWLIWPAVLIAPNSIATFQIGNAHVFMILISILAMMLFEKNRHVLGGTLLAYATLSKLFPGLLIIYLLCRKKWSAFAWTVASCFALCAVTLAIFGLAPYKAFITHQLPAIASGKAFWFAFEMPHAMLENASIMGLFYKIKGIGFATQWDPKSTAKLATWIYTVVAIAIAIIAGIRHASIDNETNNDKQRTRLLIARTWIALIVIAQLRSPFLPAGYGNVPILILIALLLTTERASIARLTIVALGMCVFSFTLPLPWGPVSSAFDFAFSFLATLLAIFLAVVTAIQRNAP